MSKLSKIIKENLENLFETKGFEAMEVAFGTQQKNDNLSPAEKAQFGPMGQLKTEKGGSFTNPKGPGLKSVEKANTQGGKDAQAYYKEVAKKIKDYQNPNDKEKFEALKTPTNGKAEDDRLKTSGYDVGISGMEVTADKAETEGGSEATKKIFKDRNDNLNKGDQTYEKMKKNAKATNNLKYKKEANNTRPVKQQKSPQPMGENIEYNGIDSKNIFKANGKLVSEAQVIKLVDKIPTRVKTDETVFAITDGENTYRFIWEGDAKSGEAVITNVKNTKLVSEDMQKMKYLWNYDTAKDYSTKKNITESGEDAFKRMYKLMKEADKAEKSDELSELPDEVILDTKTWTEKKSTKKKPPVKLKATKKKIDEGDVNDQGEELPIQEGDKVKRKGGDNQTGIVRRVQKNNDGVYEAVVRYEWKPGSFSSGNIPIDQLEKV